MNTVEDFPEAREDKSCHLKIAAVLSLALAKSGKYAERKVRNFSGSSAGCRQSSSTPAPLSIAPYHLVLQKTRQLFPSGSPNNNSLTAQVLTHRHHGRVSCNSLIPRGSIDTGVQTQPQGTARAAETTGVEADEGLYERMGTILTH